MARVFGLKACSVTKAPALMDTDTGLGASDEDIQPDQQRLVIDGEQLNGQCDEHVGKDVIHFDMQMPVFTSIMRNATDTNVLNEFFDINSNMENNEEEGNHDEKEGVKEALGEAFDEELIAKILKLSLKVKNRFYVETFKTFK